MAERREGIAFEGEEELTIVGTKLEKGDVLPGSPLEVFDLEKNTISQISLPKIPGIKIISTVNACSTEVCAEETLRWSELGEDLPDGINVVTISKERPGFLGKWMGEQGIKNQQLLSAQNGPIAQELGVELDGPGDWPNMLLRAVIVADEENRVIYIEEVPNQEDQPDYSAAIEAARKALA